MYLLRMFLLSWGLTVIVEELGTLIWGYRCWKDFVTVLWVNTITNPCVVALNFLSNQNIPDPNIRAGIIAVLEILVVLSEWRLFQRFLTKKRPAFLISLSLNAASYGLGLLMPTIMTWILA